MKPSLFTSASPSSSIAPGPRRAVDKLEARDADSPHIQPAYTGTAPSHQGTPGKPAARRLHRKPAASYIGTSLSWLDKSRLRGDGPVFLQIGGRIVYDTADLDEFLARCRRRSTSMPCQGS